MMRFRGMAVVAVFAVIIAILMPGGVALAAEAGFSVIPVLPENQETADFDYFDLVVMPGSSYEITLQILNTSDADMTVNISLTDAVISEHGRIDMPENTRGPVTPLEYSFTNMAEVSGGEMHDVQMGIGIHTTVGLTIAEAFDGGTAGFVSITRYPTEEEVENASYEPYRYVIAVRLRVDDNFGEADLDFDENYLREINNRVLSMYQLHPQEGGSDNMFFEDSLVIIALAAGAFLLLVLVIAISVHSSAKRKRKAREAEEMAQKAVAMEEILEPVPEIETEEVAETADEGGIAGQARNDASGGANDDAGGGAGNVEKKIEKNINSGVEIPIKSGIIELEKRVSNIEPSEESAKTTEKPVKEPIKTLEIKIEKPAKPSGKSIEKPVEKPIGKPSEKPAKIVISKAKIKNSGEKSVADGEAKKIRVTVKKRKN